MKFREINSRFSTPRYKGIKNKFTFEVSKNRNERYYVMVYHKTLNIRYNSLWSGIDFPDLQSAYDWCEKFKPEDFECLGADANKTQ